MTSSPKPIFFDYVIVGAGSAGCVLANRLSQDEDVTVCLIEAGGSDLGFVEKILTRVPAGIPFLLQNPKYNWGYKFEPDSRCGDRALLMPRGKILGGSSAVNGMIYVRGHRLDYDGWKALGNEGWGYDDVLPYFKKSENWHGPPSEYHGIGGELDVSAPRSPHPVSMNYVAAAEAMQCPRNDDVNGANQDGAGIMHMTQRKGERMSSARAFLHPVRSRPNLRIMTDTRVDKIRFSGRRAVGVAAWNGGPLLIDARKEVILSAGSITSPHLLLLSGVGPAEHLKQHGIDVVHDLPGVGQSLQDHINVSTFYGSNRRDLYSFSGRALLGNAFAPFKYLLFRRGPLTSNFLEAAAYVRSRPGLDRPDLQIVFGPGIFPLEGAVDNAGRRSGCTFNITFLQPRSRGSISLHSADPTAAPRIVGNVLSHQEEVDTLTRGIRWTRQLVSSAGLKIDDIIELPGTAGRETDAQLKDYIMNVGTTCLHPTSSCRMGTDEAAVVDDRLRVRGLEALRIIDASVMPHIPSGNTNAATIMIGEKGSDLIRRSERSAGRPQQVDPDLK